MPRTSLLTPLTGLTLALLAARGQTPARLQFEVATVKPAARTTGPSPQRGGPGSSDPGRVNYSYVSMKNLLMSAYDLGLNQITGPAWIDSERYDITATVPPGATKEQVNVMLQNLLADRFKLVVRHETKDSSVYELVVAKNGPKLTPYVENPNPPQPEPGKPFAVDKEGYPIPKPGALFMTMSEGKRRVTASKQTIARLVSLLTPEVDRPLLDRTGLTGEYDYRLEFRPEGPNAAPPGQALPPATDGLPNVFAAVEEQLGLKLEAKKDSIEMLAVDSGEKTPTAN